MTSISSKSIMAEMQYQYNGNVIISVMLINVENVMAAAI